MDFWPENALDLAILGQFDQIFFLLWPGMYPQGKEIPVGIISREKSQSYEKKSRKSLERAEMT